MTSTGKLKKIMNLEEAAKILKLGEDMSETTKKIMVAQRYVYANRSHILQIQMYIRTIQQI